jgi:hypothetical protein
MDEEAQNLGTKGVAEERVPTVSAEGVPVGESVQSQAVVAGPAPMPSPFWYVAVVKRNSEKTSRDALIKEGFEAYVATQTMMRRYAKQRPKAVEYVRIPAKVFLRMPPLKNEKARSNFFLSHPYISSFMPDFARGNRAWAEIPDSQMSKMRSILGDTENEVLIKYPDSSFTIGREVKAVGGILHGLEGFIASQEGKDYFCVEIKGLDWAMIRISKQHLEPIPQ